jgi:hypothetical protein
VVYQDSAGNIGIGTTTPGSKLDVKGTTALRGATTVTGNLASSGNVSAGGSLSAAGNVSASGSISANGSVAASNMTATSSGGPAMWGENFGSGGASDGMHGIAHGPASGVAGISDNANGVGVWGQSPGWALYAFGNTGQDRASGGWVKAMAEVNAYYTPYKITKCFNSTLAGAAATTPPCGIYFLEVYFGYWEFDFGFETDDRFVIASLEASDSWGTTIRAYPGNGSLVYVISADGNGNYQNALFVLMVF